MNSFTRALATATAILLVIHLGSVTCQEDEFGRPCDHEIFCDGDILHTIQMAEIYSDSKTFVDRPLRYSVDIVKRNFAEFMAYHNNTPSKDDLRVFVNYNFEEPGDEFVPWDPSDWHEDPAFLDNIVDPDFRTFGNDLHNFWDKLGRRIRPEIIEDDEEFREKNSLVWVPHPVIVPGGRFREFYYWDSYWIQMGLIQSEMLETVEGMIRNFLYMVEKIGFVPNGGRIYYQRSQPPLLIPMVKNYYEATQNATFINEVLPTLVKEFNFWETRRAINVTLNGRTYRMYRYNSMKKSPRPESYMEDFKLAEAMIDDGKVLLYSALHSGAESGIDFSSRWFVKNQRLRSADLIFLSTRSFIPVDLNGYLFYNAKLLAEFHTLIGDATTAAHYHNIANELAEAINDVLWDEVLGCWFDYNHVTQSLHKEFFPTNIVPLWAGAQRSDQVVVRVMNYMEQCEATIYPGGIPVSLVDSGEQWDFPNAWAPLVDLIVVALERSGNAAAHAKAVEIVQTWVSTNYIAFYMTDPNHMYEKYNVTELGRPGSGGEYEIVIGFGWTNGVIIEYLSRYGKEFMAPPLPRTAEPTTEVQSSTDSQSSTTTPPTTTTATTPTTTTATTPTTTTNTPPTTTAATTPTTTTDTTKTSTVNDDPSTTAVSSIHLALPLSVIIANFALLRLF